MDPVSDPGRGSSYVLRDFAAHRAHALWAMAARGSQPSSPNQPQFSSLFALLGWSRECPPSWLALLIPRSGHL